MKLAISFITKNTVEPPHHSVNVQLKSKKEKVAAIQKELTPDKTIRKIIGSLAKELGNAQKKGQNQVYSVIHQGNIDISSFKVPKFFNDEVKARFNVANKLVSLNASATIIQKATKGLQAREKLKQAIVPASLIPPNTAIDQWITKELLEGLPHLLAYIENDVGRKDTLENMPLTAADQKIIKNKYRKLALKYHPDKNSKTEAETKAANEAFHFLGDTYKILEEKKPVSPEAQQDFLNNHKPMSPLEKKIAEYDFSAVQDGTYKKDLLDRYFKEIPKVWQEQIVNNLEGFLKQDTLNIDNVIYLSKSYNALKNLPDTLRAKIIENVDVCNKDSVEKTQDIMNFITDSSEFINHKDSFFDLIGNKYSEFTALTKDQRNNLKDNWNLIHQFPQFLHLKDNETIQTKFTDRFVHYSESSNSVIMQELMAPFYK